MLLELFASRHELVQQISTCNCKCHLHFCFRLGSTCNHVAAVLFKLEYAWKHGFTSSKPCTSRENQWMALALKTVEPTAAKDMVVKKPRYSRNSGELQAKSAARRLFNPVGHHTGDQQSGSIEDIAQALYPECHTGVCFHYAFPNAVPQYDPSSDVNVIDEEVCTTSDAEPDPLYVIARNYATASNLLSSLKPYSSQQRQLIEEATRGQAECEKWFQQKRGRISASVAHRVLTCTNKLEVVARLVNDIVGQSERKSLPVAALKYGHLFEPIAAEAYSVFVQYAHSNLQIRNCGLFVDADAPFLCASPDRLVSCDCCGEGLLEIKCPKSCENEDPKTANLAYLTKAESAVQQLKRSHMYYTQVQMQMGVVGRQWCDFLCLVVVVIFWKELRLIVTFGVT